MSKMNSATPGPAYSPAPSDFPSFSNGDVLITISPSDIYKLHSDVLKRCSPTVFGELLAPRYAAQLTKAALSAGCYTRFKLELEPSAEHSNGVFVRKEVDRYGRSAADTNPRAMLDNIYDDPIPAYASDCWRNLFRTFYNIEPDISGTCFQVVLEKSVRLMDTADSIGATLSVRAYVDNSLMRQGQKLYRAVLTNPISWGNLAIRIQSPSVFGDAVIHIVGRWNTLKKKEKRSMNPDLRAICERKVAELYKIKGAIEIRILGHIPRACWRQEGTDATTRVSYANDVYMWMAMCIHSRWFFQVTGIERRGRDAPDGGAALYTAIHEAGGSYLNVQDYASFHNMCPMSQKARTILYDKLRQVKYEVREFVKDLMVNKSQLDIKNGLQVDHLLCTQITPADLPWNITDPDSLKPSELPSDSEGEEEGQMEGGIPENSGDLPVVGTEFHS